MEGKEVRFGVPLSAMFAVVDHADVHRRGRLDALLATPRSAAGCCCSNMLLGEIAPGGTGSGLYGMLILAIITVFLAGLMVGRTPDYLGKRIGATRDEVRRRCTC